MSDIREEIYFNGGLDTDSDDRFVQQGDYIDAQNISKFYDGDGGLVVNVEGNEEVENTYLPSGTNKCIGWCYDTENNGIIIFNYNSNDDHGIYRYLKDSDTFEKILTGLEKGNVQGVLDGDIDEFIQSYLRFRKQGR